MRVCKMYDDEIKFRCLIERHITFSVEISAKAMVQDIQLALRMGHQEAEIILGLFLEKKFEGDNNDMIKSLLKVLHENNSYEDLVSEEERRNATKIEDDYTIELSSEMRERIRKERYELYEPIIEHIVRLYMPKSENEIVHDILEDMKFLFDMSVEEAKSRLCNCMEAEIQRLNEASNTLDSLDRRNMLDSLHCELLLLILT